MENKARYWITAACKDHVKRGIDGGFMQANLGKLPALKRLKPNDWIIFYSLKQFMESDEKCRAFTAIGSVTEDEPYQVEISENFKPYRKNINFINCNEVSILPLISELQFIENKKSWGYPFRFGFFEIKQFDFELITNKMLKK
jgi:predicted RNA-binding protein